MSFAGSHHERCPALLVAQVHIAAPFQKQPDNLNETLRISSVLRLKPVYTPSRFLPLSHQLCDMWVPNNPYTVFVSTAFPMHYFNVPSYHMYKNHIYRGEIAVGGHAITIR